jgi:hypothetical protein
MGYWKLIGGALLGVLAVGGGIAWRRSRGAAASSPAAPVWPPGP